MKLLFGTLCVCLALAVSFGAPTLHADAHGDHDSSHAGDHDHHKDDHHADNLDRCDGIEFDAITVDEKGTPYFFKGDHLWKGFYAHAELSNGTFHELDDQHHLGHVDAAFRMHNPDRHKHHDHSDEHGDQYHDHVVFFLDDKVFIYDNHSLEKNYPKEIREVFPGIPSHLDAAVECPKAECETDSVLFFKGDNVYHFEIEKREAHEEDWAHLPNCTSAFRWLGHYYCFHGHEFTKFNPVTGKVTGNYPKDARDFFMKCPKFAKDSDHTEREKCSRVHLDDITSDDAGNVYAFRGHYYLHRAPDNNTWKAHPIDDTWKEIHSDVDTVFSYNNNLYMIKGNQVYVYSTGEKHTLLDGYPKSVSEELGIEGHVDVAFVCNDAHVLYVIQGDKMHEVDLQNRPRVKGVEYKLPFHHIDAGTCGSDGVKIMEGSYFYQFESPRLMATSRMLPVQHTISVELFGCDH
ncbi:hemopexin isoform X2 [Brienomyrus brachyistius]|uniref:hemopexin isoform X2 n=1 Tax=Brienomyrus brachyistius TaxID=42636 RepID=UPI0020B367B5|nr:hemopexin isoform X2 [Brienomyrus brachyistius]